MSEPRKIAAVLVADVIGCPRRAGVDQRADNPISDFAAPSRAQSVGHQHFGCEALFLEQLAHEFHSWLIAPCWTNRSGTSPSSSRTERPKSTRRSHRDASATLAEGGDGKNSRANNGPNFETHRRTVS
jgi:hypothetical protein